VNLPKHTLENAIEVAQALEEKNADNLQGTAFSAAPST
jgi:hypothetical protein